MDIAMNPIRFDDLEDFDSAGTGDVAASTTPNAAPRPVVIPVGNAYVERCPKCGGSGLYRAPSSHGRACFKCKGTGTLTFKQPKAVREKATQTARDRKQAKAEDRFAKFELAHPEIAAWWNATDFAFASSMRQAVLKYGDLTDAQMNAVGRCVERDREYKTRKAEEQKARDVARVSAPVVNVLKISDLLNRGKDKGIRKPIVRLSGPTMGFKFSFAPESGMNAGAVYVNEKDGTYLGKIVNGRFLRSSECNESIEEEIIAACKHPESSAIAYGQRYGICSCCGKELTNRISIELGIGPICRAKFFS